MYELGMKDKCFGVDDPALFKKLPLYNRPTQMPNLAANHKVVCGYDQGLGERLIVCDSLEDMQTLYDNYAKGYAIRINWYDADDPGFVAFVGAPNNG